MARIGIVLFSLGGPDKPESVEPFLFNLFNDPAIIGAPGPIRFLLAKFISRRRAPLAREIYEFLGGGSPLLANTEAQARALEAQLQDVGEVRAFPCMRYWHPMSDAVAAELAAWRPESVVLLPLYPQYSTTTSGSSLDDWRRAAGTAGLTAPDRTLCCYPTEAGFVEALTDLTRQGIEQARAKIGGEKWRVLFSAHGLPEKIIAKGDPYADHVGRTARSVVERLGLSLSGPDDAADSSWEICFQSRVGPLKWIGPYTDAEIVRCGEDGRAAIVVPLAFVSEHSETLVELDIEYAKLAKESGVPAYIRVPTVSTHPAFIDGLAALVRNALGGERPIMAENGGRLCDAGFACCAQAGG